MKPMKYQNLKSFEKHIASASPDHLCRVYLVQMADDYERMQVMQELVKRMLSREGSLVRVSPESESQELYDLLNSPSLFGGDPVVMMDGCESLKKAELDRLTNFLEKTSLAGYLLLGARGKSALVKVVEKVGIVLDMSDEKPWDREKRLGDMLSEMAKKEGKRLASDAVPLLVERLGTDFSLLSQELSKLICYVGERPTIERSDIFRVSAIHCQSTIWQVAEDIVWNGDSFFDPSMFPAILFSVRSQLQIGMKITSLLEEGVAFHEWSVYLPKIWPKTLEKRRDQAARKGGAYFQKGLEMVYQIESLSRSGSSQTEALFDLLRTSLKSYEKR